MGLVLLEEEGETVRALSLPHEGSSCLLAGKRAAAEPNHVGTLILDLPASRAVRKQVSVV